MFSSKFGILSQEVNNNRYENSLIDWHSSFAAFIPHLKLLLGLGAQCQTSNEIRTLFKLWVWFHLTKARDYFSLYFPEPKTEGICYSYLLYIEVFYVSKFLRQGRIL